MSTSKWEGLEVCEAHDTMRRATELKLSRVLKEERELEAEGGKRTVVLETKFYVCLDGCPFLKPKPYDGKFGADPVRRADPPDVPDPIGLEAAKALAREPQKAGEPMELEFVVTHVPEKVNGTK